ncbi:putative acetyltransferase [Kaistia soli DSM 19436]|uniref:Putative acetyltransferase n=1 Tax=Kaistia soli DSM 19436 TaxID=1122133 RepID=A0A1M5GZM6_9HYPH|nr:N-acetyltransferase [Kaistia soli]SHG09209.1 putative acetyltransferase [Kaistia soli DSM 19436]
MDWTLRDEQPADGSAISALTTAAFAGRPYSAGTEAAIVDTLRMAGALTISLIAIDADGRIVGHVAFSPVTIGEASDGWFGLGPVSVDPSRQRGGIGTALITSGLDRLRAGGAKGCVVLGDPGYYRRFGFENDRSVTLEGPPPEYFMVLGFGEVKAEGEARFHAAFGA